MRKSNWSSGVGSVWRGKIRNGDEDDGKYTINYDHEVGYKIKENFILNQIFYHRFDFYESETDSEVQDQ